MDSPAGTQAGHAGKSKLGAPGLRTRNPDDIAAAAAIGEKSLHTPGQMGF